MHRRRSTCAVGRLDVERHGRLQVRRLIRRDELGRADAVVGRDLDRVDLARTVEDRAARSSRSNDRERRAVECRRAELDQPDDAVARVGRLGGEPIAAADRRLGLGGGDSVSIAISPVVRPAAGDEAEPVSPGRAARRDAELGRPVAADLVAGCDRSGWRCPAPRRRTSDAGDCAPWRRRGSRGTAGWRCRGRPSARPACR